MLSGEGESPSGEINRGHFGRCGVNKYVRHRTGPPRTRRSVGFGADTPV